MQIPDYCKRGLTLIVDGKVFFRENSAEGMKQVLEYLLADPEHREQLKKDFAENELN